MDLRNDQPTALTSKTTGAVLHRAKSFWFDTSQPYSPSEPLRGERTFDFCIVGGGITGLSTAYHLKKLDPGASVALLEAEVIGYGASGRNAGQLIVQFGGGDLAAAVRRNGARAMGEGLSYVADGIKLIEALQRDESIDCDYAATGTMKVALRIEGDSEIERYQKLYDKMGHGETLSYLGQSQVESELASPYLGAAVFDRRGGQFNPLKLVRGLKSAAERLGVEIFENTPVAAIEAERRDVLLHTGAGLARCKKVVLATNAFTHQLAGLTGLAIQREQTPLMVKGTITEPLTDKQWKAAGWPRRGGVNVLSQMFYSFAPTIDGRILHVGGYYTSAPFDRSLSPEIEWRLKNLGHLSAFFPAMSEVKTAQTWGGPISITADWRPHLGQTRDPRILYACGCWGHGMGIGTHHGRTLAELALERRSDSTDLWFVRQAGRSWPSRMLAGLLATRVIYHRRRGSRKIGAGMKPPVRFD
ncbi:FAD-binding oxidoreductase [Agrobacterium sp. LAD9]|uniref:NAD(P)/FAD-dependent oxidoreductase n=1 Tax=Agrobacterium sp. LAD9 TaxID=2055153 RepID=UPI000D1FBDA0|nr:FAD-binding oxidoreductase [Agrobacterium sp. LAD9]